MQIRMEVGNMNNTAHAVIVTVKKNVETNILEIEKVEGVDSNNNVVITNIYTKTKDVSVKISKVDADTYEVLGGAHLQVIDPDGKVVLNGIPIRRLILLQI